MTREQTLYQTWVEQTAGVPEHAAELKAIAGDDTEIKDRFYRDLEFGTAGLRGVLGLGTNRMNIYTVGRATQGLADYLNRHCKSPSAAIAYDSRINSEVFAMVTAQVFAANGIRVYLYSELMPTPALSYAVRELRCDAGVVITASHNPAKYNGYKAYGSDGCQIGPEQAREIMENIAWTDLFSGVKKTRFQGGLDDGTISFIPEEFVQGYIDRVGRESIRPEVFGQAGLKLVYTPLNGAGNRCVQTILKRAGIQSIVVVPEQENPDGNFPTCPYPNPEIRETLSLGLELCEKSGGDLLLATDPDADRVAVAVRHRGGYVILTGNEAGVLLLDYIASSRREKGTLPENPVAVKSIVSSKLADAVAREHGVEMVDVLTGFKFIGEVILGLEQKGEQDRFIFGFEESCGYLTSGYVRDKDAVDASLLLVEMASYYKLQDKTLVDVLEGIYRRHGIYRNVVESYAFEGADGMEKMASIMAHLRQSPPADIGGVPVVERADYQSSRRVTPQGETAIHLPQSDVLEFGLENGCVVIVRPSGTEPKIKIYYSLTGSTQAEIDARQKVYTTVCAGIVGV